MPSNFPPTLRTQRQPSTSSTSTTSYKGDAPGSCDANLEEKRSLDITQRIEKKLAKYNASNNVFKRWILELGSWATSALCMGAVVGIYFCINGNLMSDNQFALNCANLLSKVASAALIVPTSEALGQLKWNWFHSSKAIWDFEIFDKASRGPWGAALLLYRTKGRSLAALGALLIVLLLAIDTFFQQVVEYHDLWALERTTGNIPRITRYEPFYRPTYKNHAQMGTIDKEFESVIEQFFCENGTQPTIFGNGTRPDIPLSCPTSNCTWPIYDTLAVCSRCADVSNVLDISYACLYTANDWTATWTGPRFEVPYPNETVCGYFLNATSSSPTLLSGYVSKNNGSKNESGEALLVRALSLTDFDLKTPYYGNGSVKFDQFRYPIMDFLIASAKYGAESVYQNKAPIVHECMLSWCVQTIKSSYAWGTYEENVLSEYLETVTEPDPWPWRASTVYEGTEVTGTSLEYNAYIALQPHVSDAGSSRSDITYGANNETVMYILNLFDDFFPSFYTTEAASATPLLRYKNYYNGPSTQILDYNPWQAPNDINRHMERLAISMTNLLRSSVSKKMVEGSAYSRKSFIHISWAWLTFPFVLLLLSLAFLVSTIIETTKDTETGVWKTSAMPTLIYGLPEETRGKFTAQEKWDSSLGDTKEVRIKLLPNLGWRVSGQGTPKAPLLPVRMNQPPPGWL
ncbi:hypothetical protein ST47_g317 [Ascochyta rabiei]|uniref:DUF3176 domain containing protein n=1 Tax=Didymella rabiei TaxID=5454 RepID=A0A163M9M3_DIDRA|nr:hypothetical protein ST47_g317 [Ascochyta rabiei]